MNNKFAVLSMDVEDWYHLYYFMGKADKNYSITCQVSQQVQSR